MRCRDLSRSLPACCHTRHRGFQLAPTRARVANNTETPVTGVTPAWTGSVVGAPVAGSAGVCKAAPTYHRSTWEPEFA